MKNFNFKVRFESSENLEFIGKIKPDGTGVEKCAKSPLSPYIDCVLMPLSLTHKTFVVNGMNTYIVKLKK